MAILAQWKINAHGLKHRSRFNAKLYSQEVFGSANTLVFQASGCCVFFLSFGWAHGTKNEGGMGSHIRVTDSIGYNTVISSIKFTES